MTQERGMGLADEVVASPDVQDAARQLMSLSGGLAVVDPVGSRVGLPEELSRLLRRACEELAAGHNVMMLRSDKLLTTTEAAEVLGMSQRYLERLIEDGAIRSETLASGQDGLLLADVLALQIDRDRRLTGVVTFREAAAAARLDDD